MKPRLDLESMKVEYIDDNGKVVKTRPLTDKERLRVDTQLKLEAYDPEVARFRDETRSMGPVGRFARGAGISWAETLEGALQAAEQMGLPVTTDTPYWDEQRKRRAAMPWDAASNIGYVAGEMAQTGPIAAAAPAKVRVASDVLASAGQQGLKPGSLEERGSNALSAGALTGAAHGLLSLPGAAAPKPGSPAEEMVERGVRLTPGQASEAGAWRMAEQGMEALPFVGAKTKDLQEQALQDWNRLVLGEIAPLKPVTTIGSDGLKQVKQQFSLGYSAVVAQAPERVPLDVDSIKDVLERYKPLMGGDASSALEGEAQRLLREADAGGIPRDDLKRFKGEFQKLSQAAYRNGAIRQGDAYLELSEAVSDAYMAVLPQEAQDLLQVLDSKYRLYVPVERATSMLGAHRQQYFTPEQLQNAIRAEDSSLRKNKFGQGGLPLEDVADDAYGVFRREIPRGGPGTAEKLTAGLGIGAGVYGAAHDPAATALAIGGLYGASKAMGPAGKVLTSPASGAMAESAREAAARLGLTSGAVPEGDPIRRARGMELDGLIDPILQELERRRLDRQ